MIATTSAEAELSTLTYAELRDLASTLDVPGRSSMRKAELVRAVAEASAAAGPEVEPEAEAEEPPAEVVFPDQPVVVDEPRRDVPEVLVGPHGPAAELAKIAALEALGEIDPAEAEGLRAMVEFEVAIAELGGQAVAESGPHGAATDALDVHAAMRRAVHGDPNRVEQGATLAR